jgi:hypothetical protein
VTLKQEYTRVQNVEKGIPNTIRLLAEVEKNPSVSGAASYSPRVSVWFRLDCRRT